MAQALFGNWGISVTEFERVLLNVFDWNRTPASLHYSIGFDYISIMDFRANPLCFLSRVRLYMQEFGFEYDVCTMMQGCVPHQGYKCLVQSSFWSLDRQLSSVNWPRSYGAFVRQMAWHMVRQN